jgi:hypothetical protein
MKPCPCPCPCQGRTQGPTLTLPTDLPAYQPLRCLTRLRQSGTQGPTFSEGGTSSQQSGHARSRNACVQLHVLSFVQ